MCFLRAFSYLYNTNIYNLYICYVYLFYTFTCLFIYQFTHSILTLLSCLLPSCLYHFIFRISLNNDLTDPSWAKITPKTTAQI